MYHFTLHGILGGVLDQALFVTHLVHHVIAGINACRAGNAVVLQSIADIYTCWTHLYAHLAIDAIANTQCLWIGTAFTRTARLASIRKIRNNQRITVEHGALETRIGTHVLAHLLAHPASITVGSESVEDHPEGFPRPEVESKQALRKLGDWREITHEGETGPAGKGYPEKMLGSLDAELARIHRLRIQLLLFQAVAFHLAFDPEKRLGPYRLRTGITAPDAPGNGGDKKQREPGDNQQRGKVDKILRPERDEKDMELAGRQIEQKSLVTIPLQPWQTVVNAEQTEDPESTQARKQAMHLARIDLLGLGVKRL